MITSYGSLGISLRTLAWDCGCCVFWLLIFDTRLDNSDCIPAEDIEEESHFRGEWIVKEMGCMYPLSITYYTPQDPICSLTAKELERCARS